MSRLERETMVAAYVGVGELYARPVSEMLLDVLWGQLQSWSHEDFVRAMRVHLDTSPYFPKPADLRLALGQTGEDEAIEAWGRVLRAAARVGRYASVDFGPEANAALEDAGGWVAFCALEEEQLRFLEGRWKKAFAAYRASGVPRGRGEPLAGLEELDRQRLGLPPPEPRRYLAPGGGQQPRQALNPGRPRSPPTQAHRGRQGAAEVLVLRLAKGKDLNR